MAGLATESLLGLELALKPVKVKKKNKPYTIIIIFKLDGFMIFPFCSLNRGITETIMHSPGWPASLRYSRMYGRLFINGTGRVYLVTQLKYRYL